MSYNLFALNFADHVFCHNALEEVLNIILCHLEDSWHCNSTLPSWTVAATNSVIKMFSEKSPLLRTLSSPEHALSIAFEVTFFSFSLLMRFYYAQRFLQL